MLFKELKQITKDMVIFIDLNNHIVIDHNEYDEKEVEVIEAISQNQIGVKIYE